MENVKYRGLTAAEVGQRTEQGLVNVADHNISKSNKEIILTHTITYFNFLNLFLAGLVFFSGEYKNMTFMGVIIINSVIGIIQEMKVKKLVDKLSVITASKASVIRDGMRAEIAIEEVVKDDLLEVENGDQICADGIVLETQGMEVNESMLTGESKPVRKKPGDKLLSGSFLVAGNGLARIDKVGEESYATVLAKKAKTKKRATSEMQRSIMRIIQVVGVLIIPIGILLYMSQSRIEGSLVSERIVATVAGVIGMIPEGLVLLTSISFILGVGRLAKRRALVQEMEAIEALARVNVLCLDKTGTITTGELEVTEIRGVGETDTERIEQIMNELAFAFEDVNNTQNALMSYFHRTNVWIPEEKIPFSSERKYRAIRFAGEGCFVLGAPEFLSQGDEHINSMAEKYAHDGFRVLLLGGCEDISPEDASVTGVKPLGLIVISDCIRPEAAATFAYFREQNVGIKVVSGDNPITVSKIAVKAGLEGGERYVDANTLPEDFEELKKVVEQYSVYGRVKPEQKQQIIKAYQANGKVTGMVGDGVNDVLALKDSDCGIAMAAGSDAAKQVSHIVLMDSNFACLKNIVSEGRTIITNIERVSSLYLTKTIYSVLLCLIFIFLPRAYPFIPIQLSWISATAIGIPSFILTLEHNESVNSSGFLRHVLQIALPSALTMVGSLLVIQVLAPFWRMDDTMTYTFNTIVGGAVGLMVVVRVCRPMNLLRKLVCGSVIVIFIAGILIAPGLLGIYNIFRWQMVLLIPLACMVMVVFKGATEFAEFCFQIGPRVRKFISNKKTIIKF